MNVSEDIQLRWKIEEIIMQECSGAIGVDVRDAAHASQMILDKVSDWNKKNQKELK